MSTNNPQTTGTNDDKSHITGTSAAAKDAGHSGFPEFLNSHGLRVWNDEDVQEGRGILQGMGYGVQCNPENAPLTERNEGNSQKEDQGGE
jgi:hypothetical protein